MSYRTLHSLWILYLTTLKDGQAGKQSKGVLTNENFKCVASRRRETEERFPNVRARHPLGEGGIRIRYLPRDDAVWHFLKSHTYCLVLAPAKGLLSGKARILHMNWNVSLTCNPGFLEEKYSGSSTVGMPVCLCLFCSLPALLLMALAPCTSLEGCWMLPEQLLSPHHWATMRSHVRPGAPLRPCQAVWIILVIFSWWLSWCVLQPAC